MSFARVDLTPDKIKEILQHINDVAHEAISNGEIIVLAKHDRRDPRRFEIIADSVYDQQLEGIKVLFENKEEFKTIFPMFANPAAVYTPPNTEQNAEGRPVARHVDPYMPVAATSTVEASDKRFDAKNVYDGNPDTVWAVNELGAEHLTDMGNVVDVGAIWVKWYKGDERQYRFSVAYYSSLNNSSKEMMEPVHLTGVYSSGTTKDYEVYNLSADGKPVSLRYLIIKVNGNTSKKEEEKNLAAIKQIQITKASAVTPTNVIKEPGVDSV